ncbi:MAG: SPFH domain-containing protein [Myxococcales bacterium]|nr:SPFH domain-containing protein [Myxococcales bacterium]
MLDNFGPLVVGAIGLGFLLGSFVTVRQGTVGVVTMFGKYRRVLHAGLNFKLPWLEAIQSRISVQNRSVELEFQAITVDQAQVGFKAMLLYSVLNHDEETIKNVAFKFIDERSFMQALVRTVEGSVRSFVATKRQSEILKLRKEIVDEVKDQLDASLETWGYHLIDLQMNDIFFDQSIMDSMARVVASANLRAAAENEGQALLITKTKQAEAEGRAIQITAEAQREASRMQGQGVAQFREEMAKGVRQSIAEMTSAGLDPSFLLFFMWTEALKHVAENGKGNMIFLDGSVEGMERTLREMMGVARMDKGFDRTQALAVGRKPPAP